MYLLLHIRHSSAVEEVSLNTQWSQSIKMSALLSAVYNLDPPLRHRFLTTSTDTSADVHAGGHLQNWHSPKAQLHAPILKKELQNRKERNTCFHGPRDGSVNNTRTIRRDLLFIILSAEFICYPWCLVQFDSKTLKRMSAPISDRSAYTWRCVASEVIRKILLNWDL
jgi:hypothetical protein